MKLDKDLVREILLQVEAYPHPMGWVELSVPGHSAEEIAHHVELLDEAGFIEAQELTSMDGYDWRAKRLTYEGHEFLDTVRDGEVWRFTKETAKKSGVASVQALFDIGKSYAKQKLLEHGVHLT
jgi:Hypothetical protein (DUF2513)